MSPLPLIHPPSLRAGATIGLLAPASPPHEPGKIPEAIARLEAQGFRVKKGRHLEVRDGYLAGTDEQRAEDFNAFFADPEVDALLALRGGYGSCRILPLLDYAALRAHPKIFLGYSDNTALHQAILKKAGLVTYHGPNASELFLSSNVEYLRQVLFDSDQKKERDLFSAAIGGRATLKTIIPGHAMGPLIGGNMTCLLRLLGTPFAPDFSGAILFLEDIGEKAYRIDGMFTQLRLAGALKQIAGLVLGRFSHDNEAESARIEEFLQREAQRLNRPCLSGAPIGHFPEQIIVPHGALAELNADQKTLRLILPATPSPEK